MGGLPFDVNDVPLAIVDQDRSTASRELIQRFLATDVFEFAGEPSNVTTAARWLQDGNARLALIIPEDFQRTITRTEQADLQILLDGSNSNLAAQARGYALQIVADFETALDSEPPAQLGVDPVTRVWYNPDQSQTSFMVLSMVALAALMVGVIYPAASIVREKESGTIEQLRVTPITTGELFVAKTLPTIGMGLLAVFPSLLIARWFDVPLRGSLLLFLGLTALFLLSAVAIGVFVASVSRSLQQALLLSFFGLFPLMFLSGTLAPVESMPEVLQTASMASPLRHYMDVILGIFLKGAGIENLWPQALSLLAIGAPLFAMAAWSFHRQGR